MLKKLVCLLLCALLLPVAALGEAFSPVGAWTCITLITPERELDLLAMEMAFCVTFREDMTCVYDDMESVWRMEGNETVMIRGESGKERPFRLERRTMPDGTLTQALVSDIDTDGRSAGAVLVPAQIAPLPQDGSGSENPYRSGLTEADFTGTWKLSSMVVRGVLIDDPEASNTHMTIRLENGRGVLVTGQGDNTHAQIVTGTLIEQQPPEEGFSISTLRHVQTDDWTTWFLLMQDNTLVWIRGSEATFLFAPAE